MSLKKGVVYALCSEGDYNVHKLIYELIIRANMDMINRCMDTSVENNVKNRLIEVSDEIWHFGRISARAVEDLEFAMQNGKNIKFFDINADGTKIDKIDVMNLRFKEDGIDTDNVLRRLKEYAHDMGVSGNFAEIERKWLLSEVPKGFPLIIDALCEQAYLSISPEVRIRERAETGNIPLFFLDVKNDGALERKEISNPISEEKYETLKEMLDGKPVIKKIWHHFLIDGNREMEVTVVDPGSDTEFIYAEVEFGTRQEAEEFVFPIPGAVEVTDDPDYKMKNYWKRTRMEKAG